MSNVAANIDTYQFLEAFTKNGVTYPSGMVVAGYLTGTIIKFPPDTTDYTLPFSITASKSVYKEKSVLYVDGTVMITYSSGLVFTHFPDGTITLFFPPGISKPEAPEDLMPAAEKDAQGNAISNPNGLITEIYPDELDKIAVSEGGKSSKLSNTALFIGFAVIVVVAIVIVKLFRKK
jgi:hypothetical protein